MFQLSDISHICITGLLLLKNRNIVVYNETRWSKDG